MSTYFDTESAYDALLRETFPPTPTEAWEQQIFEDLARLERPGETTQAAYERKLVWSPEALDFKVQPYYRAADLADVLHLQAPPADASPLADRPHSRGGWIIRQDVVAGSSEQANRLAKAAAEGGATAVGFVVGLVPGDAAGVPVQRREDFRRLLQDLPLEDLSLHFATDRAPSALLALWLLEADQRGLEAAGLRGSIDHDPLERLLKTGRASVEAAFAETARLLRFGSDHTPHIRLLTASSQPYHEAGASPVQELAFLLATVSECLARLGDASLPVPVILRHLQLRVPVSTSYFMEMAKLRALRLLFAQVAQAYAPEAAAEPFIHAVTSRWMMTRYDPYVNLLRGTTAAASAILGGCDVLTVRPFDELLGGPDDFSYRLARNTQLILRHEAHLDRVAGPAGGSYYVEKLTDQLARAAWPLFQEIEAAGGIVAALRSGTVQAQIARVRRERQEALAARRRVMVGINQYPDPDERAGDASTRAFEPGPGGLEAVPGPPSLPVGALKERLQAGAALADVLKDAPPAPEVTVEPLPAARAAEVIEAMRLQTERFAAAQGRTPSVLLLPFGDPVLRNVRAAFARNFFGCAGFQIHEHPGLDRLDAGPPALLDRDPDILVLCSADDDYPDAVPALRRELEAHAAPPYVVVAGYPEAHLAQLRSSGVDDFIHLRSNLLETLRTYQRRLGIVDDGERTGEARSAPTTDDG